jgi:hypothetical protein
LFKVAQIFSVLFPWKKLCINFDKKWFGLPFGQFFTNSSGHPGSPPWLRQRRLVVFDDWFLSQSTFENLKPSGTTILTDCLS